VQQTFKLPFEASQETLYDTRPFQNNFHIWLLYIYWCTILIINIFSCVLLKIMKNWYFDSIHRDKSNNISYVNIYLYTLVKKYDQNSLYELVYMNSACNNYFGTEGVLSFVAMSRMSMKNYIKFFLLRKNNNWWSESHLWNLYNIDTQTPFFFGWIPLDIIVNNPISVTQNIPNLINQLFSF
jgi:hypothetical protein